MNFDLTDEQIELRKVARDFAEKEIRPIMEEDEKEHKFRPEIVKKMAELGFFGGIIPEEYGGTELGFLSTLIINEEIAKVSPSYGLPFNMQAIGPALTILKWGTDEQKKKYIPALIDADMIGAFAITEPNSGSDVASMKTTAKETDNGWLLNGQKMWISNAHIADIAIVYAYTDKDKKHKGISAFLVELKNISGITTTPIETKLGLHSAPTGEIAFDDALIPKDAMLGARGDGFKICMSMLDNTRLSCATRAVGVAQASLDYALQYSSERQQFGRPLNDFQMIQAQLAEMHTKIEAARLLVYRAGYQKDKGLRNSLEVSTAKHFAADTAVYCSNEAMKIFGSYGFSTEYPVERLYRDAKSFQVVEGTSNIQKLIIASYITGKKKQ